MADGGVGRLGEHRLGPEGDAEAGGLDHEPVIGAVAEAEGCLAGEAEPVAQRFERPALVAAVDEGRDEPAGEHARLDLEAVGAVVVEADQVADMAGEGGEAAGNEGGGGAMGAHRQDELPGPRHQPQAFAADLVDDAGAKALEQADPGLERLGEIELAAHRPGGDRRHLVLDAGEVGELVDALDGDDGAVHIGDEQLLAPALGRQHGAVYRLVAEDGVDPRADAGRIAAVDGDLDGRRLVEPAQPAAELAREASGQGRVEGMGGRIGDEADDVGHGFRGRGKGGVKASVPLIVIGGATASGKSALALRLAEATGGTVVNADSVQLYKDLPILTARPGAEDEARAEHRLYGVLDAEERASAARWVAMVQPILDELAAAGRPAIVTGGTGLYLAALLHGLAPVPEVPEAVRAELRASPLSAPALHEELAHRDPAMAAQLEPTDRQRILRALEVVMATGRSLADWQRLPRQRPRLPEPWAGVALLPPRPRLRERIARRLDAQLEAGLLDEIAAFIDRPEAARSPLLKADGVAEFAACLRGACDLETAKARTRLKIGRYAKRQATFFRHQLPELALEPGFGEAEAAAQRLLTRLRV